MAKNKVFMDTFGYETKYFVTGSGTTVITCCVTHFYFYRHVQQFEFLHLIVH